MFRILRISLIILCFSSDPPTYLPTYVFSRSCFIRSALLRTAHSIASKTYCCCHVYVRGSALLPRRSNVSLWRFFVIHHVVPTSRVADANAAVGAWNARASSPATPPPSTFGRPLCCIHSLSSATTSSSSTLTASTHACSHGVLAVGRRNDSAPEVVS